MIIRRIAPADNAAMGAIIQAVLREFKADKPGTAYYDEQLFNLYDSFQLPAAAYWVVELAGKIVGGGGIYPTAGLPGGYCELVKLYLLPEARGKGLGRRLIDQCLLAAKALDFRHVYLETMPELNIAIPLYEKMGFRHLPEPVGQSGHYDCTIYMIKDVSVGA